MRKCECLSCGSTVKQWGGKHDSRHDRGRCWESIDNDVWKMKGIDGSITLMCSFCAVYHQEYSSNESCTGFFNAGRASKDEVRQHLEEG